MPTMNTQSAISSLRNGEIGEFFNCCDYVARKYGKATDETITNLLVYELLQTDVNSDDLIGLTQALDALNTKTFRDYFVAPAQDYNTLHNTSIAFAYSRDVAFANLLKAAMESALKIKQYEPDYATRLPPTELTLSDTNEINQLIGRPVSHHFITHMDTMPSLKEDQWNNQFIYVHRPEEGLYHIIKAQANRIPLNDVVPVRDTLFKRNHVLTREQFNQFVTQNGGFKYKTDKKINAETGSVTIVFVKSLPHAQSFAEIEYFCVQDQQQTKLYYLKQDTCTRLTLMSLKEGDNPIDVTALPHTEIPLLIKRGNQYFLYGKSTSDGPCELTSIASCRALEKYFPLIGAASVALDYKYLTSEAQKNAFRIATQEFIPVPITDTTQLLNNLSQFALLTPKKQTLDKTEFKALITDNGGYAFPEPSTAWLRSAIDETRTKPLSTHSTPNPLIDSWVEEYHKKIEFYKCTNNYLNFLNGIVDYLTPTELEDVTTQKFHLNQILGFIISPSLSEEDKMDSVTRTFDQLKLPLTAAPEEETFWHAMKASFVKLYYYKTRQVLKERLQTMKPQRDLLFSSQKTEIIQDDEPTQEERSAPSIRQDRNNH